ncbi:metallopeptidase [Trypanosoma rangeli SC58]|nr:metallopeptidase [Trypanosoma rangeli SC58]
MVVTSAFALPVDASEVECAMNDASQLYMLDYLQYHQRCGSQEGCIGWYHSHPGYTCFLSGTDVSTQQLGQKAQDPWLAIVIDPVRTISTGRLDMKAFRTFSEEYAASLQEAHQQVRGRHRKNSTTPTWVSSDRIKEYGIHAHRYYELPITLVCSKSDEALLDSLWSRFWALTFCSNPLTTNRQLMTQQIHQLTDVLESELACGHKKGVKDDECQFYNKSQNREQYSDAVGNGDETHVSSEAFKEKNLHARHLVSALDSEVALGGTLLVVKNCVFQA